MINRGAPAFDPKLLVEQGAVQPLDDAVGPEPIEPGTLVLDGFELEEQLLGAAVLATAKSPTVAAEHRADAGAVHLEAGQHIVVEELDSCDGQLVGVEPGPGVSRVAVDGGLQIDLADALRVTTKKVSTATSAPV